MVGVNKTSTGNSSSLDRTLSSIMSLNMSCAELFYMGATLHMINGSKKATNTYNKQCNRAW